MEYKDRIIDKKIFWHKKITFFYSKVAEKCKENNWNFIDSGIAFQQLHIQAIYPGHSELFDTIIDYEDTSDEAPECVIKQFPTHVGKEHSYKYRINSLDFI